jgi:glucose/arabinose dehydrogenase
MSAVRPLLAALLTASVLAALSACGSSTQAQQTRTVAPLSFGAQGSNAARSTAGRLRLVSIGSFAEPLTVTGAPGDPSRVFVAQKAGQVELVVGGHKRPHPFLDISGSVNGSGGEQGLLGLAFPRDYARTGLFYVDYTMANNDLRVAQYRRSTSDPNHADPASARTVLTIDHHAFTNHNGGQLAFGPDGYLYIGVGDGGSEGDPSRNGQSTGTLLAKILRIAPSATGGYTIPSSNPFRGQAGRRAEIWAYGLRNPWRFSFDRRTGDLIIGDVGQDRYEEIDFQPAGSPGGVNYGWSVFEAFRREKSGGAPHAVFPKVVAPHSSGYCAIIGGFVVRDRSVPSIYGRYLFGDNCRPQIESVKVGRGAAKGLRATGLQVSSTSSFGEDARGHVYISSLAGSVYRLTQR